MTVEERRGSNARGGGGGGGGHNDQFPVGMRVLAVDDDPVCLKVLECLLRRCQYHVTTTNQAIVALKMLRENRDRFDLVISDVHMPDMDGFKLLELVGLEMDLPVIMLSANGDPKAVMQGITHGACDYLLKPVRIEELKNIWQHVVRRWKIDSKDHHTYEHGDDSDKPEQANSEDGHTAHSGHSARLNKRRKDPNEEDDDDCGDSGRENDDTSAQKKPRVVWTADLHRKFVAAVNQLGIDKAMPKRILDLMNDDKLTRENVASHLQKYRLYLKRISLTNQQASIAAALGANDSTYLPMGSFDGGRSYHGFTASGQLSTLASFQQGGMLGRLNGGMADPGMYSLGSCGAIQFGHSQNNATSNVCDLGKLSNITFSGTSRTNLLQGMPTSLEFNQLQQQKAMFGSSNPIPSGSTETRFSAGISNNSLLNTMNNSQMLQQHLPNQQQSRAFGNPSTAGIMPLRTDPFELSGGTSSYLPDLSRCDDKWPAAPPLSGFPSQSLPLSIPFSQQTPRSNGLRDCVPPVTSNIDVNLHTAGNAHLPDTLVGSNLHSRVDSLDGNILIMPTSISENPVLSDTRGANYTQICWEGQIQSQMQKHYVTCNPSSNPVEIDNGLIDDIQKSGFINGSFNQKLDATMIGQSHFNNSPYSQNCNVIRTTSNGDTNSIKLQGALDANGYNTFDDMMNAMTKREWEDVLMDGDINCDAYSLGACM